jgi:hypothetical protein
MKPSDLVRTLLAAAVVVALMPGVAGAQMPSGQKPAVPMPAQPACAVMDKALPAPWTGWTSPEALKGGTGLSTSGKLTVGRTYSAALTASEGMTYVVPLPKPAAPGTFGGLFTLTVDTAGTYSIALGEGAWIDVAPAAGKVLSSVAHGHGPACTSIHKVVDFALQPGAYVIQVSGAPTSPVVIAVAVKP